jgi:hypothetical protein
MPKKIHSIANKNLLMAKYWEKFYGLHSRAPPQSLPRLRCRNCRLLHRPCRLSRSLSRPRPASLDYIGWHLAAVDYGCVAARALVNICHSLLYAGSPSTAACTVAARCGVATCIAAARSIGFRALGQNFFAPIVEFLNSFK